MRFLLQFELPNSCKNSCKNSCIIEREDVIKHVKNEMALKIAYELIDAIPFDIEKKGEFVKYKLDLDVEHFNPKEKNKN